MAVVLPPETDALFAEFERDGWKSTDRDGLSSLYPNFAVSTGSLQDEVDLDLLAKWDSLSVSDPREEANVKRNTG